MSYMLYFASDVDSMTRQERVDLLAFAESVVKQCDKVVPDGDSVEVHVGKGLVRIPKKCSTYKRIRHWARYYKKIRRRKPNEDR